MAKSPSTPRKKGKLCKKCPYSGHTGLADVQNAQSGICLFCEHPVGALYKRREIQLAGGRQDRPSAYCAQFWLPETAGHFHGRHKGLVPFPFEQRPCGHHLQPHPLCIKKYFQFRGEQWLFEKKRQSPGVRALDQDQKSRGQNPASRGCERHFLASDSG